MARFRVFLVLGMILQCCGPSAQADTPPLTLNPTALRATLQQSYRDQGVKAMLATVRSGGQDIISLAQGESMTGVEASLDQCVRIGGVSQTYMGTLLMLLVERGVLKLDDKISKWLPELLRSQDITVEMLMQSTSGYKDYIKNEVFLKALLREPFARFTRDELISFAVQAGELDFEPGTQSHYAHTNLVVLGKLLEKATGKSMAQLYRELLLDPLRLERTGYSSTAALPEPVLHAFGDDREIYEEVTYWDPSWAADSGPLYAPIGEVARWARVHGRGELLTAESQARLIARPAVAPTHGAYYACGFVVSNGWYFFNPNFNGYLGTCAYHPGLDVTIVVYATNNPTTTSATNPAFQTAKELSAQIAPQQPLAP